MNKNDWTLEEIAILQNAYEKNLNLSELFPNRTLSSIQHKASRIGLKWHKPQFNCKYCGIELNSDNWYKTNQDKHYYICNSCSIKESRKNKLKNPEKARKWLQENYLKTGTKSLLCKKRPKPDICEICGKRKSKVYHHWGKAKRKMRVPGIWVCHYCHSFAEIYDKGLDKKYVKLKRGIIRGEDFIN